MVSRKKAAAKARKAAKAKAREEQAKEMLAARFAKLPCHHGADPHVLNVDSIVFQCVHTFGKVFNEDCDGGGSVIFLMRYLSAARTASIDKFAEVWSRIHGHTRSS